MVNWMRAPQEKPEGREHPDFPGYIITKDGKVFSRRWNLIDNEWYLEMSPVVRKPYNYVDYLLVNKDGARKHKFAHRLVAEVFIPNPDGLPEVNHIDKDPLNNRIENLEWISVADNRKHAAAKGAWRSAVKPEDEKLIVEAYQQGATQAEIAAAMEISQGTVSTYLRKHGIRVKRTVISDEDLEALRNDYLNKVPVKTLAREYGVSLQTAYKLVKNERRYNEKYATILQETP